MAETAKYGLDALANIRKRVTAGVDLPEGSLFGIDTVTGEAILADATLATPVRAVGVVYDGSGSKWGEAIEFNKVSILKTGDFLDLEKFAILETAEGEYTNAEIGNKIYLGAGGAYTVTPNVTPTQMNQWVGQVWSRSSVLINLIQDPEGTIIV